MTRLSLRLSDRHEWVKLFDPRGSSLFVATDMPPSVGAEVRIDLLLEEDGPRVILRGHVLWRREGADGNGSGDEAGCAVGLVVDDREKINFLNGFVRGGLINRRERRRLPLRLPVIYGGLAGAERSFTRDFNDEGAFILSDVPLPEHTIVHFVVTLPGRAEPVELKGEVSHTVVIEDEDVPGMGIRFLLDNDNQRAEIVALVDRLESEFLSGTLPDDVIS